MPPKIHDFGLEFGRKGLDVNHVCLLSRLLGYFLSERYFSEGVRVDMAVDQNVDRFETILIELGIDLTDEVFGSNVAINTCNTCIGLPSKLFGLDVGS